MEYFCNVCDNFIKPESKYEHFKSNTHKEFDKCKHMKLTIENPDINNADEVFHANIFQHNKKYDYHLIKCNLLLLYDYHLIKCNFKLVFNDDHYSTYVKSNLFDNTTMISWKKIFGKGNR